MKEMIFWETSMANARTKARRIHNRKFPGLDRLIAMLETMNSDEIARELKVTRHTVTNWVRRHDLQHKALRIRYVREMERELRAERRRIAEGIHEDVLQRLCVVKMALFQPPGMDTSTGFGAGLCNAEKEVSIVISMLRSLTFDLASPILKDLGLSAGLKTLCAQLEQQHGVPVRFERDEHASALSPAVEIIVFNAARELLRNAFQHSGAKTLFVALQRRSGCMELIVEDDGIGLNSEQQAKKFSPSGGYGLFNIRKRMQHLQGEMRITPATPRGTRIVLAVPLTADCAPID
jgi:signal transduction histidine kinase